LSATSVVAGRFGEELDVATLIAASGLIALGDIALVVICWRSRTVLGGLLGVAGIPLVVFAAVPGFGRGESKDALLGAGIALAIGAALYGLGHVLERLLDEEPERRGRDWH
jgi:hypothetical protein